MEPARRSRRAEIASLRADLAAKGAPLRQVAQVIRARYNLNSRVAYRLAGGLTQQEVADRWNELWPSQDGQLPITHKHVSYWEARPLPTGRPPSPDTLNRLARIYRTSAAELLDGEDHTEGLTPLLSGSLRLRPVRPSPPSWLGRSLPTSSAALTPSSPKPAPRSSVASPPTNNLSKTSSSGPVV